MPKAIFYLLKGIIKGLGSVVHQGSDYKKLGWPFRRCACLAAARLAKQAGLQCKSLK